MLEFLFVYGTLQNTDIQQKIIGKILKGESDVLENHTVLKIRINGEIYPVLTKAKNKSVSGLVLDILPTDFPLIDEYETDAYKRVKVRLKSGKAAWVYKKYE